MIRLTPNLQDQVPSLVGCWRLLIHYIRRCPPYLEAISFIHNLGMRHAVVTDTHYHGNCRVDVEVKFKNKVVPVDKMNLRRLSGDIAPLILNVRIRLMSEVNFMPD